MTPTDVLTLTMSSLTVLALLYGEATKRRTQRTQAQEAAAKAAADSARIELEKQQNAGESEDRIAERRLGEIVRLDALTKEQGQAIGRLTAAVAELQKQRGEDARTIREQADELELTNEDLDHAIDLFSKIKAVFAGYADRIQAAWPAGGTDVLPMLTPAERALLDAELPRRARRVRERDRT